MENASKALIIAGAILLSILIISLGIMVYNNAKNTMGSANLDKQAIEAFNSQWESYIGSNKTASEVKSMAAAIIASNAAEGKSGTNRKVTFVDATGAHTGTWTDDGTIPTNLSSSITYTITPGYADSGLINQLKVSK